MAALIAFAGLPGTGKSTIGKVLSVRLGAVYLRVDEIESVIRMRDPAHEIGPEGYLIATALAVSNLRLGHDVIVDCVNPWPMTRAAFEQAAAEATARFIGVEVSCTDTVLHRGRVENRICDVPNHINPDWRAVESRDYKPWLNASVHIDTAYVSVDQATDRINAEMRSDIS